MTSPRRDAKLTIFGVAAIIAVFAFAAHPHEDDKPRGAVDAIGAGVGKLITGALHVVPGVTELGRFVDGSRNRFSQFRTDRERLAACRANPCAYAEVCSALFPGRFMVPNCAADHHHHEFQGTEGHRPDPSPAPATQDAPSTREATRERGPEPVTGIHRCDSLAGGAREACEREEFEEAAARVGCRPGPRAGTFNCRNES